jgi:transcriptional regulator GlxA family with amidase domain
MKDTAAAFLQWRITFNAAALRYYPALARVERYVQAHMRDRITLEVAAGVACLERKYFSAFFHSRVGVTFKDWIAILRVQRAIDAMRVQRDNMPRIAFAAGFRDVRSFERAFKKLTGVTPQTFRVATETDSRLLPQKSRNLPRP